MKPMEMTYYLTDYKKSLKNKIIEVQQDTAKKIWEELVSTAPMDTGGYISSIQVSNTEELDKKLITKVFSDLDSGWKGVPLACLLEWGTGIVGEGSNTYPHGYPYRQTPWTYFNWRYNEWITTNGMPAYPHWFPAFEKYKPYYERRLRERI